jgi:hypothetical protein
VVPIDPPVEPARVVVETAHARLPHGPSNGSRPSIPSIEFDPAALSDWPRWTSRIVSSSASKAVEGGRRTRGEVRAGTADRPLVTYVTAVRNNAGTLGRAIESVQRQTYENVEHVILDGASTDGTLDVIASFADVVDYFASEPDQGLYQALNKAIPLARGDIVCVLNSDDWLEADAAEMAVLRLQGIQVPTLLLTAATVRRNRHADERVEFDWFPALVHPGCYFICADVCHNGIYATRSAYESSGPYDQSYEIAGDFNWIMACLESGANFEYTRKRTINYVMGGLSSDPWKQGQECIRTMRRRFPSLTPQEANGLHHCFFFLPASESVPDRPDDYGQFLRRLLVRHSDDADLLQAVAWAVIHGETRHFDLAAHAHEPYATMAFARSVLKLAMPRTRDWPAAP